MPTNVISRAPLVLQQALFAPIAVAGSGANKIVTGQPGKTIIGMAYNYMANGTVNVKWQSASTDLTGLAYLVVNTGKVVPFCPTGWFQTADGEDLNLNTSTSSAVGGELVYYFVNTI